MHGKARSQVTPHAHWIAARAEAAVDGGFGVNRVNSAMSATCPLYLQQLP